jgi:O-antigen/teichoic acid export membrane protein
LPQDREIAVIVFNAAAQLVALGSIVILQTVYTVLVARSLGPEAFGRYSFAFAVSHIILFACDLGLHGTIIRRISVATERSRELLPVFFSIRLVLALAGSALLLIFARLFVGEPDIRWAFYFFSAAIFFHAVYLTVNVSYQAHGKLYLASAHNVVQSVLQLTLGLAVIWMGAGVVLLAAAYFTSILLAFVVNVRSFQKYVHPLRLGKLNSWREYLGESLPAGMSTVFRTMSARIDVALLTWLAGTFETGIYSAAARITLTLNNVPIAIFSAVLPAMASAAGDPDRVRELCLKSSRIMVAAGAVLAVGFYLAARPLTALLYGSGYEGSAANLQILAWSLIPVFLGMAFGNVLLSQTKLVKFLPFATGLAMVINLAANRLLIPRMGSLGASVSTLITETALALFYIAGAYGFLFGGRATWKRKWRRVG